MGVKVLAKYIENPLSPCPLKIKVYSNVNENDVIAKPSAEYLVY